MLVWLPGPGRGIAIILRRHYSTLQGNGSYFAMTIRFFNLMWPWYCSSLTIYLLSLASHQWKFAYLECVPFISWWGRSSLGAN